MVTEKLLNFSGSMKLKKKKKKGKEHVVELMQDPHKYLGWASCSSEQPTLRQ